MRQFISIIIPIYNESQLLSQVISNLIANLNSRKFHYELILVENGSSDSSGKIADNLARKYKSISSYHLPRANYGKAIYQGYLVSKGDYVANFSVDWVDMDFFCQAIKALDKRYDLAVATKYTGRSRDKRPFHRRIGGSLFQLAVSMLFGLPTSDTHGIKVINRHTVMPIIKKCRLREESIDTELNIRAYKAGLRIKEIPVTITEKRGTRIHIWKRAVSGFYQLILLRLLLFSEGIL